MTSGVAIDKWKKRIFESRFEKAELDFETGPGVTKNTLLIRVTHEKDQLPALHKIVEGAEAAAQKSRNEKN